MKKKMLLTLIMILSVCTLMFTLTACEEKEPPHTHTYDQQTTTDMFMATEATCEYKATYYYSCSCGAKGTETFEHGYTTSHNYGDWISNNNGTHTKTCANNSSHQTTKDCNGGTATCQERAICNDCSSYYGIIGNHNADTEWTQTETHHYHACLISGCAEKLSYVEHSFTNYVSDNNATYESDGTKTAICDGGCGKINKIADSGSKKPSSFALCNSFTVNENEAYMKVSNETTNVYFSDYIEIVGIVNYSIYKDSTLTEKTGDNLAINNYGANTFYVVANVNDVDITYVINIYRRNVFTVSFNTEFGSSIDSQKIEEDSFATEPNPPTKQGYTFSGWDFDFSKPITNDFIITALWENESYTCYLNSNGGYFENCNIIVNFYVCDSLYLSQSLESGQTLNCPIPEYPNPGTWKYNFAGWYKDSNFVEKFDFDEEVNQDLNLYARFLRYFQSATGGESNVYLSTNFTHSGNNTNTTGFNLICLYTGKVEGTMSNSGMQKTLKITNQNGDVLFEGTSKEYNSNYKVEYEFEVKKYDIITFEWSGSSFNRGASLVLGYLWKTAAGPSTTIICPTSISIGVLYDKPTNFPIPKKDGMKFVGWFDIKGNEYTDKVWKNLSNITLYAKWEEV